MGMLYMEVGGSNMRGMWGDQEEYVGDMWGMHKGYRGDIYGDVGGM